MLVLLRTVLIIDRVTRMRKLRNQSRAIAVQAMILAEAARAVDAVKTTSRSTEEREAAPEELRTFTLMLLTCESRRPQYWRSSVVRSALPSA